MKIKKRAARAAKRFDRPPGKYEDITEQIVRLGQEFQEARVALKVSLAGFVEKGVSGGRIAKPDFLAHCDAITEFADRTGRLLDSYGALVKQMDRERREAESLMITGSRGCG